MCEPELRLSLLKFGVRIRPVEMSHMGSVTAALKFRSAIAKQYKLSPQRRGKPFIGRSTLAALIDERERAREGAARRVVRYTTARDDALCINGDGSSSCSSFQEGFAWVLLCIPLLCSP